MKKKYQEYLDYYINKTKKPLVLVGINDNIMGKRNNLYYNVHSHYNYFIKLDDKIILKQKCIRFILEDLTSFFDEEVINDIMNNNESFIKLFTKVIKRECSLKNTIKQNKKWETDYKEQGYKIMSPDNIYRSVIKLLQNNF